jgi:hypothetical protein
MATRSSVLLAAWQVALASSATYPPPPPFLSNAFGDHMVLQRDRAAVLYGFAPAGAWVMLASVGVGSASAPFQVT